jgi:hypothetical protein
MDQTYTYISHSKLQISCPCFVAKFVLKNPSRFEAQYIIRNMLVFIISPCPTPSPKDHPFSAVCDFLFIYTFPSRYGSRLLHPYPEEAPCHGDKKPSEHGFCFITLHNERFPFGSLKFVFMLSSFEVTSVIQQQK